MPKTLLYITANPKPLPESRGLQVGEAFLDAYSRYNPADTIVRIPLCATDLPVLTVPVIDALFGKMNATQMDRETQTQYTILSALAEQFRLADRYVFVTPMWNLGYPPVLKSYLDSVCVAGKTFHYTDQGPQGLLQNKKSLHIQAAGGLYSLPATQGLDVGAQHLQTLMGFLGVTDHTRFLIEGLDLQEIDPAQVVQEASVRVRKLVPVFGQSHVPAFQ